MIPIGLYTHTSSPYFLAPKLLILLIQGAMTNTLSHLPLSMNLCSNPRPLLFPLKGMSMYSARSSAFGDDLPSLLSLRALLSAFRAATIHSSLHPIRSWLTSALPHCSSFSCFPGTIGIPQKRECLKSSTSSYNAFPHTSNLAESLVPLLSPSSGHFFSCFCSKCPYLLEDKNKKFGSLFFIVSSGPLNFHSPAQTENPCADAVGV